MLNFWLSQSGKETSWKQPATSQEEYHKVQHQTWNQERSGAVAGNPSSTFTHLLHSFAMLVREARYEYDSSQKGPHLHGNSNLRCSAQCSPNDLPKQATFENWERLDQLEANISEWQWSPRLLLHHLLQPQLLHLSAQLLASLADVGHGCPSQRFHQNRQCLHKINTRAQPTTAYQLSGHVTVKSMSMHSALLKSLADWPIRSNKHILREVSVVILGNYGEEVCMVWACMGQRRKGVL